jgi:hypothetical protein
MTNGSKYNLIEENSVWDQDGVTSGYLEYSQPVTNNLDLVVCIILSETVVSPVIFYQRMV